MKPLSPSEIQKCSRRIDEIKRIDDAIRSIGKQLADDPSEWGERVRDIFGRNRLVQFRHSELGSIAGCAVINALLQRRGELIEDIAEVVEVSDPPCPPQEWNAGAE